MPILPSDFGVSQNPVLQVNPMAGGSGLLSQGSIGGPLIGHSASASDFAAFDPKFIGTGMGHAYNGHGFYFSENPGYAAQMKNTYFPEGKTYTTRINAGPNEMFDLDAPASMSMLNSIKETGAQIDAPRPTNRDVLGALEGVATPVYRKLLNDPRISTGQQGASNYLAGMGFKGNTYSDVYGRHYVVYDPADLRIIKKQ